MQQYLKITIGTFPLDTLKENFTGGFKIKPSVIPLCKRPLHIPERAQMHLGRSISAEWTAASKHSELFEEYAETNSTKKEEEEKTKNTHGHPIC